MTMLPHDPLQPAWSQSPLIRTPGEKPEDDPCGQKIVTCPPRKDADGNPMPIEGATGHMPYVVMLDPSGNICNLTISTNRDRQHADQNYRMHAIGRAMAKGWLTWHEVPSVEPYRRLTLEEWAVKREEIRADRRAAAAQVAAQFRQQVEKTLPEALEKLGIKLGEANAKLVEEILGRLDASQPGGAGKVFGKRNG